MEQLKKLEGQIIAVDYEGRTFWASLKKVENPEVGEQVSFSFDLVNKKDRLLVIEGSLFYWAIDGRGKSTILFRGLISSGPKNKPFSISLIKQDSCTDVEFQAD
jgi:hypothetical protein